MHRFFLHHLRTIGADQARTFYAAVLGRDDIEIFELHENARARGAQPHWLGYIEVDDVDAATRAFTERGARAFGKWTNPRGLEASVLRDPGGAIVALGKPPAEGSPGIGPDVGWCVLNTTDVERATSNYGALFGWKFEEPQTLAEIGAVHPFAYAAGEASVGSMVDIAERSGVHTHWIFCFQVKSLDGALAAARAGGATCLPTVTSPSGDRIAVCDDPQGAAFALIERRA